MRMASLPALVGLALFLGACAAAGSADRPPADPGGTDPVGAEPGDRPGDLITAIAGLEGPGPAAHVYACDDGSTVSVVFEDTRALVTTGARQEPLVLPRQPAASGLHYMTAIHDLRAQGNEAMWTVGRRMPSTCRALWP